MQNLRSFRRYDSGIGARICAHIAENFSAQADNRPVAPAGNFEFAVDFTRVVGRLHMLKTVFDPFDGPAELARGKGIRKSSG